MTCGRSVRGGCGAAVWQVAYGLGWSRTAQRGALGRYEWPTVAQKQKARRGSAGAGLEGKEALDATS
jgi:hypothetical protein